VTLADFLARTPSGPEVASGTPGEESDWLFFCDFELRGARLQILDVYMAGNLDEGVILNAAPGTYAIEAKVMTFGIDRRVSRVRVQPKGRQGTLGEPAGEVGVDLAAIAVCDVDRLAPWAQADEDQWQQWGEDLWFGRTDMAGIYSCRPADTVVPFIDSGFGDGTYPVHYLTENGRPIGLEVVFLPPGTPYF